MKRINSRHLSETLRIAEQEKLIAAQPDEIHEGIMEVITPEAIKAGVGIEFGGDKFALQKVLDALGVESGLKRADALVHINQAIVTTGGATKFVGSAIPALTELSLLEAVDTLQAKQWSSSGAYAPVQAHGEVVTSKFLLMNSTLNDSGELAGDPSKPAMVVGTSYRYNPAYTQEEWSGSLAEDVRGLRRTGRIVKAIARELHEGARGLLMPGPNYFLRIGRPVVAFNAFTYSDVVIHGEERYAFQDGHFSRLPMDEGASEG